tara:strand:+ start:15157 stop:15705 length:549 start_codon:yes stop_codon:yes gene_type:complete
MAENVTNNIDSYYEEIVNGIADPEVDQQEQDYNEVQVDALLHVIERERQKVDDVNRQLEKEVESLKDWQAAIVAKHERRIDKMTALLYSFFTYKKLEDPEIKTISFPNGTLKTRKQQPLLIIEDRDEFFRALGDKQELVRIVTKYDPDKKAIMKYIKETGDVPLGVSVEDRDDKFTVTTGGK